MKKLITLFIICCTSISVAVTTPLYHDSFNRADSLDMSATTDGMSGLLAPMTYVERDADLYMQINPTGSQTVADTLSNIENDQLHMADGPNMGLFYLDHNFTDAAITNNGGMRIGLTIVSNDGTFTDNDRFVGFGVGNTLAECQTMWFDFNGDGLRGRIGTWAGFSDLWIGWSPNNGGKIQVYKNGPTSEGGDNYAIEGITLSGNDRLELELFFDSFADGSPVNANILWNGLVIGTESFAWDTDGLLENYIGFNARQDGAGFTVDDLAIVPIPRTQRKTRQVLPPVP